MKELTAKLRYMGRQYSAGSFARGGGGKPHYLTEAADTIEKLQSERDDLLEALKKIADDGIENSRNPAVIIAKEAIAKAEGSGG